MPSDDIGEDRREKNSEKTGGYKRPPKQTQFKPGQSGNPKGRPAGAKNQRTIVEKVAKELHWVEVSDGRKQYSTLELVLASLRNLALQGNVKASRRYHHYFDQYTPNDPPSGGGYVLVPEVLTIEEWLKEAARLRVSQQARIREFEERYDL